jgi:hypothetical protein
MIQGSQYLSFMLKTSNASVIFREFLRQDLYGNFTLQLLVFGSIDLAESTLAE